MRPLTHLLQRFAVGAGLDENCPIAEFSRTVSERGHDQMRLGTVHPMTLQRGP
jgi:hypothetical protein